MDYLILLYHIKIQSLFTMYQSQNYFKGFFTVIILLFTSLPYISFLYSFAVCLFFFLLLFFHLLKKKTMGLCWSTSGCMDSSFRWLGRKVDSRFYSNGNIDPKCPTDQYQWTPDIP